MSESRETFKSRLGFLLVSAGCAIGMGNVWKFPWVCGRDGGGVFVLFYCAFLLLLGLPVLTMEFAHGRASRKATVAGYKVLEPAGSGWHVHGYFALIGNFILMMFYTNVAGWMINYFCKFLFGSFKSGMSADAVASMFPAMLSSPVQSVVFVWITIALGMLVCALGVRKGVEDITTKLMIALFALILVLVVRSFTLSGTREALKFYLIPDWKRAAAFGFGKIAVDAMNQAFFTLSVGICSMQIFGTYMSDDHKLVGEAGRVILLDTFIALAAGLMIFPALFTYMPDQVDSAVGPGLIFVTLPNIFTHMPGGRIWGTMFFMFMVVAAMSTVIAVFENIIASLVDLAGWTRKKAIRVSTAILAVACLPVALEGNLMKGITYIRGLAALDSEDFLVSNLLLPTGALIFTFFSTRKFGWGFDKFTSEVNKGVGLGISTKKGMRFYLSYILPIVIVILLFIGVR